MSQIPLYSIDDFFRVYGLGKPINSEIMCMRLEDQPDSKLMSMPLYRSGFYRVIQFTDSALTFTSTEKRVSIVSNCLSFSYPGKLESWDRKGRLYGTVVYFTEAFAQLYSELPDFRSDFPFFTFEGDILLTLTEEIALTLKTLAEEMITEMYSENHDKTKMIRRLLSVYLHKISRLYRNQLGSQSKEINANQSLFNKFRKTNDEYFNQLASGKLTVMPSVSILANNLGVSANYLNEIIKKVSGEPASIHIQRKMLLEIKSYLLHTNLQVAEIAYQLGFENVPYFNRFFKKHTSHTPIEFRKNFTKTSP